MSHGVSLSKEVCLKTKDERNEMNQISLASVFWSIMYVMICTRSDVSYDLSICSRYQADLGDGHWIAVENILKYLRQTKDIFFSLWRLRN